MTQINQNNVRETWATRVGVILAVTGSAVGLGNFLRFPGLAAEYGGGTFIVPYIISLLILGIPIALAEWGLGRFGGTRGYNSTPGIFRTVWRRKAASYMGVLGPVLPMMIYMYYVIVQAWCLGYAWMYMRGTIKAETPEEAQATWAQYVGVEADGSALRLTDTPVLVFAVICFLINFFLIYWGIRRGIELFCRIAMPALVICAIIVLIRVLTLPAHEENPHQNVLNGLGYMWNPVAQAERLAPGDENVEKLIEHAGDAVVLIHSEGDEEGITLEALEIVNRERFFEALTLTPWQIEHLRVADEQRFEVPHEPAALESTYRGMFEIDNDLPAPDEMRREIRFQRMVEPFEGRVVLGAERSRIHIEIEDDRAEFTAPGFFASMANPDLWLAAASQVFFTLSVGFGIIITYSSYMRRRDDVALSSVTACAGNTFCELALAGMIVIPAAFVLLGVGVVANPPGTFGMGFHSLPAVFTTMPDEVFGFNVHEAWNLSPGHAFGFLFFFLLFLAAVTSAISMLQPGLAFLEEGLGLGRRASTALLATITGMGAFIIVLFSQNALAMDTMDFWVGHFLVFVMATIQVIFFAWILGAKRGLAEIDEGAELRIPRKYTFMIKYITPTFLLIVFAFWLTQNAPARIQALIDFPEGEIPVPLVSAFLIVWVFILFITLTSIALRRWKRQEAAETDVSP